MSTLPASQGTIFAARERRFNQLPNYPRFLHASQITMVHIDGYYITVMLSTLISGTESFACVILLPVQNFVFEGGTGA